MSDEENIVEDLVVTTEFCEFVAPIIGTEPCNEWHQTHCWHDRRTFEDVQGNMKARIVAARCCRCKVIGILENEIRKITTYAK